LGVAVFEMITGQLPFDGRTPYEIMVKVTHEPLPVVTAADTVIPEVVHHFVSTLTQRDLDKRYASGREVVEDLNALRDGQTMPHLSRLMEAGTVGPAQQVPGLELNPPGPGD